MAGRMNVRWPETLIAEAEPYRWIMNHLFPNDFWTADAFEAAAVLYRCEFPAEMDLLEYVVFGKWRPARFSPAELDAAIIDACRLDQGEPSAFWWHVNVHDNCVRCVERVGLYAFDDPLAPLFLQLQANGAAQGSVGYAGLLDHNYR